MTYSIYGGPVTQSASSDLQQNFHWMYAMCNAYDNLPSYCLWQDFQNALGINSGWSTANGDGVLMFYMLETQGVNQYYSYAFVKAQRDAFGAFTPAPGANYFSILPTGGLKFYITPPEIAYMNQCILNYETLMMIRNFTDIVNNTSIAISSLANHPKKAFFSAEIVWQFYNDNASIVGLETELVLQNGAVHTEVVSALPPEMQYKAETPILTFRNGSNLWISDEVMDTSKPFLQRGMDLAAKCPPSCT